MVCRILFKCAFFQIPITSVAKSWLNYYHYCLDFLSQLLTFSTVKQLVLSTVAGETHCTTLCVSVVDHYRADDIANLRRHGNNQSEAVCQSADYTEADGGTAACNARSGGGHCWCSWQNYTGEYLQPFRDDFEHVCSFCFPFGLVVGVIKIQDALNSPVSHEQRILP